jgi:hypothetical protein
LMLAAWSGREREASQVMASATARMLAPGEARWLTATHWATAVINNGLCRYDAALVAAEKGSEFPEELGLAAWSVVELIEAAARTGQPERAGRALRWLSDAARASGTDWAIGLEARSRALLSEGEDAEQLYKQAIERLGRTRARVDLARAHLVYGEWLRRENRRVDARKQLRVSQEMLQTMGIEAFAGADSQARGERTYELGNRYTVVYKFPHRRMAPPKGVHEARAQLSSRDP